MRSMNRRTFLKLLGALGAAPMLRPLRVSGSQEEASLVLLNGKIVTMDATDSVSEAVAVRGTRILAVGPTQAVKAYIGRETGVIDLQGKTVTPGLIDAHAHLPPFGSRELFWVKLQGIGAKQRILELLAERAGKTDAGMFIYAWGVESGELGFLNRRDLDGVSTRHPILVVHTTGQWGFANSAALKMAGITSATASPEGSLVEKGPDGQPTGLLVHYPALYLVRNAMPSVKDAQMERVIRHAAALYCREGVTAVHDNFFMVTGVSNTGASRLYVNLAASGSLPVRLKIWPYLPTLSDTHEVVAELFGPGKPDPSSPFFELGERKRADPDSFARIWGGLKIAVDGSGPTAGWYRNPQALMLHSRDEIRKMVGAVHRSGQQISVHAVGNLAVDTALDAFEAAQKENRRPNPRHRIEHALLPTPQACCRIRESGAVVCTHPQFIYAWGDRYDGSRKRQFFPLHTFLAERIRVAFGADPPAFPLWQPQVALWQSVARMTRGGERFSPDQSISIRQALRLQTMGSAYAAFQERDLGSLEKGKLADLVVWDRDFLTAPTEEIRDAKALTTIVGGKIVYSRNENDRKS